MGYEEAANIKSYKLSVHEAAHDTMPLNRGRIVANKKPCKLFVNNLQGLKVIPLES